MHLTDLKRPGTQLRDVEPLFAGMPLAEWQRQQLAAQAEAWRETPEAKKLFQEQKWPTRL
jgi:hypothetical protein